MSSSLPTIRFAAVLASLLATATLPESPPAGAQEVSQTPSQEKTMERTVTVSASAVVSAMPDEATVQTGVSSEAKTAREALSKNSTAMSNVIAELKSAGIAPKDIQTTQFNVEPVYIYPKEGQSPPQVTGYRAHNMVSVLVRNLDRLGEVLDQLVSAGANQMNGISFDVSQAETLRDDARKQAMANALRRAKLYAEAAGAQVGEIVQIQEDVSFPGPRPMVFKQARAAMAEAAPVERGSQDLEARVIATWKLK
ncbi:MAG TPA: SIMPL domain-containing protein [Hyphomicrobium sp.]|nr:SIMPL domain-containing protein [Hyphomicrobium sp.]